MFAWSKKVSQTTPIFKNEFNKHFVKLKDTFSKKTKYHVGKDVAKQTLFYVA